MRGTAWLAVLALALTAGCLSGGSEDAALEAVTLDDLNPFGGEGSSASGGGSHEQAERWPPEEADWETSGRYSQTIGAGPYEVLEPERHRIESHDGTVIDAGAWRPDVPEGTQIPVVLRFSVDYGDATVPKDSVGPYAEEVWIEEIVPHGFAFVQVSIRGTGESGGCNDFYSPEIQEDLDVVISYFANRSWSNGNVAAWGISDAGIYAWAAAAQGNPNLETILPGQSATSLWHMAYRNGTPISPIASNVGAIQWARWATPVAGSGDAENNRDNLACPGADGQRGAAMGSYTVATGAYEGPVIGDHWKNRDFRDDLLADYSGSVFLVHGFQDWTTHPAIGWDVVDQLNEPGNRVKTWLGQWAHRNPDDSELVEPEASVRWDFAETVRRWLATELTSQTLPTGPAVEVQDDQLDWRSEQQWPPSDADWTTYHLGDGELSEDETASGRAVLETPGNAVQALEDAEAELPASPPRATEYRGSLGQLDEDLRFSGLARLHLTVRPSPPEGSRMYAELIDVAPDGTERFVAHAVMDLRYHQGGTERHQLVPGQPIVAQMEFYPADVVVPAGHALDLRVINGVGHAPARFAEVHPGLFYVDHPAPTPVVLAWGEGRSVLELPEITRDVGDGCYPGQPRCG